ncbi:CPBP family intramembrane glutamic endopeptidase [Geodermatophilus nigrescens]|uniref:CAAX protease self-immunity n=1 Tax=Geodermatophilus nigrescens TaxID=1070870 RepID=A0A1M5DI15_9ACTN|nr:CPBP family intramembrane glutamic endopeptidase [Geodermatophilus nigrescens]SHF66620.1 CAAX protease self-immunity [Geodermatophilus nigrescens]
MTESQTRSSRTGSWDRPATWKAFALVAGYLVFYVAVSQVVGLLAGDRIDDENVVADPGSTFFALVLPIGIGALALLAFTWRVGWLPAVFGRQPVAGRRWMWIAPVLVLAVVVGHAGAVDRDGWTGGEIAVLALLGVCIGVAEELATRGLAVEMLRDAGHGERFVAVVSSLLFALMHLVNLIQGMELRTVLATVGYTFCFGMCMYLAMRVTGTIWTAIVLHGLTDPTTILATGGVDEAVGAQTASGWSTLASVGTFAFMAFALVAVFLVRGRAGERTGSASPA